MVTGAFVRIKRGDEWHAIEIDQLSDDELTQLKIDCPDDGWKWALFLSAWIRDNIVDEE